MDHSRIRGVATVANDADSKARIVGLSPLGDLEGTCREAVLELGRVETLPRRVRIVDQGEPTRTFVLLGSGRVRLERMRNGRAFPLGHRGPGETVGENAITGSTTAGETVTVVDEAQAVVFPMSGLRKLVSAHASLRAAMAAALVDRHRLTEERLASLLLHGVEARLIDFLFSAARRWGAQHAEGELVTAPFTHADIALLIGSTRETVTLLLGKLKRDGLVQFDKRRIVIRDRAGLERRAAAS
jgi:CRP/FNR family cyclic AMP-dependent transcriptional regulator